MYVPIGACPSGGFDSTAVVSAMSRIAARKQPRGGAAKEWRGAFIASFPGKSNDETPQALEAAAYSHAAPQLIQIDDGDATHEIERMMSDVEDLRSSLPTAVWQTYQASRRNNTDVSLDGRGADELMGGYREAWLCAVRQKRAVPSNRAKWLSVC
jgi:asparagine synthase (glutamine-hydrolysing)